MSTSKEELCVVNGVLLKGTKVIIPSSMRREMVKLVHDGHLGIEKCKRRAREVMYWPYCICTCQHHRYQQRKEPLLSHSRPEGPWSKVEVELW